MSPEGTTLTSALIWIALAIDLVGVALVLIGALKFVIRQAAIEFRRLQGVNCVHQINRNRVELGGYILSAIEFMIVSDIVHTVATRELDDLYILGGLVFVRTAISYFLEREINAIEKRDAEPTP